MSKLKISSRFPLENIEILTYCLDEDMGISDCFVSVGLLFLPTLDRA